MKPSTCLMLLATFAFCALVASPVRATEWEMVWQDEFNTDGPPDPANWDFEHGFVRNHELQWYQPENAVCRDGILVIEARREHKTNPAAEYTSACLLTRGKREWTYGKFEMRARIDPRAGSWPAFWTLGIGGHWPQCGEIDIMEYYRGKLLANVAYGRDNRTIWSSIRKSISEMEGGEEAWAKQFHTWTMEWDEHRIDLLLDDKLINHFDVDSADQPGKENPFRHPHYILLNQAIGGDNGGDPSQTTFPVRMEVDWVRVYQAKK